MVSLNLSFKISYFLKRKKKNGDEANSYYTKSSQSRQFFNQEIIKWNYLLVKVKKK